jgi:hypothetical protein
VPDKQLKPQICESQVDELVGGHPEYASNGTGDSSDADMGPSLIYQSSII